MPEKKKVQMSPGQTGLVLCFSCADCVAICEPQAIKLTRTRQDPRIDLPAVGLSTVASLVEAGGRALCFEAEKMPFFQKETALALADRHGIVVLART